MQLAPGDSDDAPARGLEAAIPGAVLLERVVRVVRGAAVELDDDALLRPDAVDLDAFDADVRVRARKTCIEEEGLEALLELASHDAQAALCFFNDGFEDGDSRLAGVAPYQRTDTERVGEPELLGLPHRAAHLVTLNDSTEVEERAGHGRDRDAVVSGDFVDGEVGPMSTYAGARSPASRDGDLNPASAPDAPQRGCRVVAQHRARSARQHCGHPKSAPGEEAAAHDGVDAAVHAGQPTDPHPVIDRVGSKAKL